MMSFRITLTGLLTNISIVCILLLTAGCEKQEDEEKYVAKVNDSLLTSAELNNSLGTYRNENKFKEEFIKQWVQNELLYQEAVSEGLTETDNYKILAKQNEKELAASLFIKKYFSDHKVSYTGEDLLKYYNENKNNFLLKDDVYILNVVRFNDENKAIHFRNTVIESDWNKAVNVFKGDNSVLNINSNRFYYKYEISPPQLLRAVENMLPNEVNIVSGAEQNTFVIVQLINAYKKGNLPEYELVKEKIKNQFLMLKRKQQFNAYINELYSKYKVRINKEYE